MIFEFRFSRVIVFFFRPFNTESVSNNFYNLMIEYCYIPGDGNFLQPALKTNIPIATFTKILLLCYLPTLKVPSVIPLLCFRK